MLELARRSVPTLHVIDGIVEWRNTWENPTHDAPGLPAMPLFRPILSHKVACLGRSQARLLESWGNRGKCEVVGLPRLDGMIEGPRRPRRDDGPFRILVATARTPGFTPDQLGRAERSLLDVKAWFETNPSLEGRAVEPVWRVSGQLTSRLGLPRARHDAFGTDLPGVLEKVDAMVSTPSTLLLEGMLAGIPVALLDYNNRPPYVPAAWSITAPEHVGAALGELLRPAANRMEHQEFLLHEALECRTPAAPRLRKLISEMIRIGRECRREGKAPVFPERILEASSGAPPSFETAELYPQHEVLRQESARLQAELGHLRRATSWNLTSVRDRVVSRVFRALRRPTVVRARRDDPPSH